MRMWFLLNFKAISLKLNNFDFKVASPFIPLSKQEKISKEWISTHSIVKESLKPR